MAFHDTTGICGCHQCNCDREFCEQCGRFDVDDDAQYPDYEAVEVEDPWAGVA